MNEVYVYACYVMKHQPFLGFDHVYDAHNRLGRLVVIPFMLGPVADVAKPTSVSIEIVHGCDKMQLAEQFCSTTTFSPKRIELCMGAELFFWRWSERERNGGGEERERVSGKKGRTCSFTIQYI